MRLILSLAFVAVVWFHAANEVGAAVPTEAAGPLYTILDPGSPSGVFGISLAVAPGQLAVTAQRTEVAGQSQAGAVYLFDEQTGQLQHTILNPEPTERDEFGMSVAFVGNDLLVGAYGDDFGASAAGSAYLFDTATGALKQTIRNPEPQAAAVFGISATAIEEGFAVGAIGVNRAFAGAGSVYLFDNAGNHTLTLDNPNPTVPSSFAYTLASTQNLIAVGARGDRHSSVPFSPRAGVVQVFDTTTGQFLNTLRSTHPVEGGQFGVSIAAIEGKVIVGAPMETVNGQAESGRIYVFDGLTGSLEYEIENPTGGQSEWFGYSIDIAAGNVLVGAPRKFVDGRARAGGAYLFDLETGDLLAHFESPSDRSREFGWAVAGTPTTAFASTWMDRRVYAFTAVPEPSTLLAAAVAVCLTVGRRCSLRRLCATHV